MAQTALKRDTGDIRRIVSDTKNYYDGPANEIYRNIWGENIHIGYFERGDESLRDAMARANERMVDPVAPGPEDTVLDVGCGYGAFARYLAKRFGCKVVASNISDRELEWGEELTSEQGLDDKVSFKWADFHELPFANASFDVCVSQEAFLHAVDKALVMREVGRILKPGGRLIFTDLLVRDGTADADRERIYERVNSPVMWDTHDYKAAIADAGLRLQTHKNWSSNVAPTYAWVRNQLKARHDEFERKIGKDVVDRTLKALQFWVDQANNDRIGWEYFVATKPAN
jgi:sarcosine/dimethylglycine N-methyltransferase